MKLYEYQRLRSFFVLGPSHSDSIFSNFFSSITAKPIEAKFYVALSRDGEMKVSLNGLGHMTKLAAMPIHGKNLLLDIETWYAAFGTQVLPNLSKWWPWVDLDIFYSKVKWSLLLMYGKTVKL